MLALGLWMLILQGAYGCTSAIISADRALSGRMLLWKHRDSGHPHNFVAKVDRGADKAGRPTLAFVGLFNAGDRELKEVWAGMNEAGLGIMNTASYNLAPDTAVVKDREGLVMAEALKSSCRCLTVNWPMAVRWVCRLISGLLTQMGPVFMLKPGIMDIRFMI